MNIDPRCPTSSPRSLRLPTQDTLLGGSSLRHAVWLMLSCLGTACAGQPTPPPSAETSSTDAGTTSDDDQDDDDSTSGGTPSGSTGHASETSTSTSEGGPGSETNSSRGLSSGEPSDASSSGPGDTQTGGSGEGTGGSWDGCDEFVMPADCTIPEGAVLPGELRCTGLYSDWETRTLRCGVQAYVPAYELWSDGAAKQRYVWLPPGETIDVSDPDEFDYPVGTRFWKEFHVGEAGGQRLGETRLMLKVPAGWLYTSYVWSEDGQTAVQNNDGVDNLFGTGHSVPTRDQCKLCHNGRTDFILGWDIAMLGTGATGVTLQTLVEDGRLSGLDDRWLTLTVPGDEVERAALGYLHANCGVSCHNTTTFAEAATSGLNLRLNAAEMESPLSTAAAVTGINRPPGQHADYADLPEPDLVYYDFRPLDSQRSLSIARMEYRGSEAAMPPLGTHVIDDEGVAIVTAWVASMTTERGYPAPAE